MYIRIEIRLSNRVGDSLLILARSIRLCCFLAICSLVLTGDDSHLVMAENTFQVYESYSTETAESVDHSKKITTWTTPEDVTQWQPLAETEISAGSPQAEILLTSDMNVREEKSTSFKVLDGDFVTVPLSPLNLQLRQNAGAVPPARSSDLVEFILPPPWCPPKNPIEVKPATRQSKRLAKQKTGTGNGDLDKENLSKKSEYFPRSLRVKLRASLDKVMGKDKTGRDKAGNSKLTLSVSIFTLSDILILLS